MLLDPSNNRFSQNHVRAFKILNAAIEHLSAPARRISFRDRLTLIPRPRQSNDYDCGAFVCQYAMDTLTDEEPNFVAPNVTRIREEMSEIVKKILQQREILKSLLPSPKVSATHGLLVDYLESRTTTTLDSTEAMDVLLRANMLCCPDKYKIRNPPSSSMITCDPIQDAAYLQNLYDSKPGKVKDKLMVRARVFSTPTLETLTTHFTPTPNNPINFQEFDSLMFKNFPDVLTRSPIDKETIKSCFEALDMSSAAGSDKISYSDLKNLDPKFEFLSIVFNHILINKDVPKQWKTFETLLIIKPGKEGASHIPSSWRPLACLDAVYRIFTKILNDRLMAWMKEGKLLHPYQKAIGNKDGCHDNNFIVRALMESSRWNGTELHLCFMDLADAFGSIPFELIWFCLNKAGLHQETISLIKEMYTGCTTQYKCQNIITGPINLLKGVKQGCALSMSLFCLCINVILCAMNEADGSIVLADQKVNTLAYADDLVVAADSHIRLERFVNKVVNLATRMRLTFRPSKCGYYSSELFSPNIRIYNNHLPRVTEENTYGYLGVPFGNIKCHKIESVLNKAYADFDVFLKSVLKPSQIIHAQKVFIHSQLPFALRSRIFPTGPISQQSHFSSSQVDVMRECGFDQKIKRDLKNIMGVTERLNSSYLYASTDDGGLGLLPALDDYHIQRVVAAFRCLISDDEFIRKLAQHHLILSASKARESNTDLQLSLAWLSNLTAEDRPSRKPTTWWASIRRATAFLATTYGLRVHFYELNSKIELSLTFNGPEPTIFKFNEENSTTLCKVLHNICHKHYFIKWRNCTSQGLNSHALSLSKQSNKLIINGCLPISEWKFSIRARNNLLSLQYSPHRYTARDENGNPVPLGCRRCAHPRESQSHVLNQCPYTKALWINRHDSILEVTVEFLRSNGIECTVESSYPDVLPPLEPDITVTDRIKKTVTIIDIKSPYDSLQNIENARSQNETYYATMAANIANHTGYKTSVHTMCVCSLGSWDPRNDKIFLDLGLSQPAINVLAQSTIRKAISVSSKIYRYHVRSDAEP